MKIKYAKCFDVKQLNTVEKRDESEFFFYRYTYKVKSK